MRHVCTRVKPCAYRDLDHLHHKLDPLLYHDLDHLHVPCLVLLFLTCRSERLCAGSALAQVSAGPPQEAVCVRSSCRLHGVPPRRNMRYTTFVDHTWHRPGTCLSAL